MAPKASAKPEKKAPKKAKDPSAPKRPLSAFILFSTASRNSVLAANPGIKFVDVTRVISKQWHDLAASEKATYEAMAAKDKQRYETEMAAYEAKNKAAAN